MYLGLDFGTGSVKAILQHDDDTIIATGSASYPVSVPEEGAAETHPDFWISALNDALSQIRYRAGLKESELLSVAAIGLSGQMHGIVPISEDGKVLYPAVLWADTRGSTFLPIIETAIKGHEQVLLNAPNSGMTAITLLWLKESHPRIYQEARWFLFPKDYVRYKLTGRISTDYSDASGSLLYNFKSRSWDVEICKILKIDIQKLPPIQDSTAIAGLTTWEATQFGLSEHIPVATGAGDTPAALFGSACFETPMLDNNGQKSSHNVIQISVGTAVQVVRPMITIPAFNPALNYYESVITGQGYHMAAMLNGGLALERVREWLNYNWDEFYCEFDENPYAIPSDLVFLPYLVGERTPYRNVNARGAWIGLGLHHTRQDLMAAALFGVACTVRLGLETLIETDKSITLADYELRFVGGSSRRLGWVTLIASVIGQELTVYEYADLSVKGAAALARTMITGYIPRPCKGTIIQPKIITHFEKMYSQFKESYRRLYEKNYSSQVNV